MTKCQQFLKKKNRCCKFDVIENQNQCGNHLHFYKNQDRVQCPFNKSHWIIKNELEKHLKVCNSKKMLEDNQKLICQSENINILNLIDKNENLEQKIKDEEDLFDKKKIIQDNLILIHKLYNNLQNLIKSNFEQIHINDNQLSNFKIEPTDKNIKHREKHDYQQTELCNIVTNQLIRSKKQIFIELGAGTGGLSKQILNTKLFNDSIQILIDKGSFRMDKIVNKNDSAKYFVQRVKIDIKDLDIVKLFKQLSHTQNLEDNQFENKEIVLISKHLCGAATDMSIEIIKRLTSTAYKFRFQIAMCCHHRCNLNCLHVDQNQDLGVVQKLFKQSSYINGAVNESTFDQDMTKLGYQSKRFVDLLRLKYLCDIFSNIRKNGDSDQKIDITQDEFCDRKFTPENMLLQGCFL